MKALQRRCFQTIQPEEAAAGQATAAANQAFAEEMADNPQLFAKEVQEIIGEYTTALGAWTDCVADNASGRGSTQTVPGTRTGGEFDPTQDCGEKPVLVMPVPADLGPADPEDVGPPSDLPVGPPSDLPLGPPEDVGPPSDLPLGPPEDVGPPSDLPLGPPEDVGLPSDLP